MNELHCVAAIAGFCQKCARKMKNRIGKLCKNKNRVAGKIKKERNQYFPVWYRNGKTHKLRSEHKIEK